MNTKQAFDELCGHVRNTSYLQSSLALLEWDQQTKLPTKGGQFRAEQITFLAGDIHRRNTDPRIGELLSELVDSDLMENPHSDSGATIRELKREYEKKAKLPTDLVKEQARAASIGQQVWIQARKDDDFASFAPTLKNIFQLKREQADAVGYSECRYDALLDDYEPYAKTSEVTAVLEALRVELVPLVAKISESSQKPDSSLVRRNFPTEAQEAFGRKVSSQIGFDYERGRLDITHHPFCTEIGPDDVRITTRYDENFFNSAFFGTLHEAGHGMYEQGLRGEFYGLPPGAYCSLGMHESQSRLWENLVGRSRSFWKYFYPEAQKHFTAALGDVAEEDFFYAINEVKPSLIRVEADEATYNLHIIIRFEIEQALIEGDVKIDDLPELWNQKYQQYLGIRPDSDANGVLQDIHWSAGLVGYFPTYSLGNLYASQLYYAAAKELGDLEPQFAMGDFAPLKVWLNEQVHEFGKCYSSPELGEKVTGKRISHHALMKHLEEKMAMVYGI